VLRETTSRGLYALVCPSRTSERGGKGDYVKEGGGGKGSARGSVHWACVTTVLTESETPTASRPAPQDLSRLNASQPPPGHLRQLRCRACDYATALDIEVDP
jgi:hypothetical protein